MWEEDVGNCYSDVVLMEIESPSEYFVRYFLLIYFFSLGRAIACASWSNWERIQYYARNSSKFNGTTRVLWIYVLITTGNICIYWKYLWSRPHVGFSIKFTIIWALFFLTLTALCYGRPRFPYPNRIVQWQRASTLPYTFYKCWLPLYLLRLSVRRVLHV